MISERTFAARYTSFWRQALPMAEEVTDVINKHEKKDFSPPRGLPDQDLRQDLIGELSLSWFTARVVDGRVSKNRPDQSEIDRRTEEASVFIGRLRGSPVPELPSPSEVELKEAEYLTDALTRFVRKQERGQLIVAAPEFAGCGLLEACSGDLLIGQTLFEVKAVDRGFHQPDLRQLVIYCALNFANPRHDVRRIGLINPRRGTYFRSDLEWIVQMLSGQGAAELFYEILDFVSTERVSA